jgi:hypothetical protein
LVAVCGKCHGKIHIGNYEGVMNLHLTKIRGNTWRNYILKHERDTIKSDMVYWQQMKDILEAELNSLTNNEI